MSNKPLNIGEEARVQMPMKTVASLIVLVAMGVFGLYGADGEVSIVRDIT